MSSMDLLAVVAWLTLMAKGSWSSPVTQYDSVDVNNESLGVNTNGTLLMQERSPAICNIMKGDEQCKKTCKYSPGHCEDSQFPIRSRPECVCDDPCSLKKFKRPTDACRSSCTDILRAMTGRCVPLNAGIHSKCNCRAIYERRYVSLEEARQRFGPNAWQYKKEKSQH